jgi:RNA polymerase sigma factor (sigma-70 family)
MQVTKGQSREAMFLTAMADFGPSIGRLVRGYEHDLGLQDDLLQDIQVALWKSLAGFEQQCSLRTWVYRVAHNVSLTHVSKAMRRKVRWINLDELGELLGDTGPEEAAGDTIALARLRDLIRRLKPPDAQIMMLWLEGENAAEIGNITGVAPGTVATKIHRIKAALAQQFLKGEGR